MKQKIILMADNHKYLLIKKNNDKKTFYIFINIMLIMSIMNANLFKPGYTVVIDIQYN